MVVLGLANGFAAEDNLAQVEVADELDAIEECKRCI
jgi:hypothetical protein